MKIMRRIWILFTVIFALSFTQAVFAETGTSQVGTNDVVAFERARAAEWVSRAPDTELDKALAVYTYVCLNYEYDYDLYSGNKKNKTDYTIKGEVMSRMGTCMHYAKLTEMFMTDAGIDSKYISAQKEDPDEPGHAWDVVKIGGEWYFVDATWDGEHNIPGDMDFKYFMKSNSAFEGHSPTYSSDDYTKYMSECTSEKYNNYWWGDYTSDVGLARGSAPVPYNGKWYYVNPKGDILERSGADAGAAVRVIRENGQGGVFSGRHLVVKDGVIYFMGNTVGKDNACRDIYQMNIQSVSPAAAAFTAPEDIYSFGTLDDAMFYQTLVGNRLTIKPVVIEGVNVPVTDIAITPSEFEVMDFAEPIQFSVEIAPGNATDKTVILSSYGGIMQEDGSWIAGPGEHVIVAYSPGGHIYKELKLEAVPAADDLGVIKYGFFIRKNGKRFLMWEPQENSEKYVVFQNSVAYTGGHRYIGTSDKNEIELPADIRTEKADFSVYSYNEKGYGSSYGIGITPEGWEYFSGIPTNVTIVQQDADTVRVCCDPVDGANRYGVSYIDLSDMSVHYGPNNTKPEVDVSGLEMDKEYMFLVHAYKKAESSSDCVICYAKLKEIPAQGLIMSDQKITLYMAQKLENNKKLSVGFDPFNATDRDGLVWSSDDPSVATVDSKGEVTAAGRGETIVRATLGELEATCAVEVIQPASTVIMDTDPKEIYSGEKLKIPAHIVPENANNQGILWSSSDESVATVLEDGTVEAHKVGSAVITATAADELCQGFRTKSCTVYVKEPPHVPVSAVSVDPQSKTLSVGESFKVSAAVQPDNASDKTIEWWSPNDKIATVDADGTVHAVRCGDVAITALAENNLKTAECQVNVRCDPQNAEAIEAVEPTCTTSGHQKYYRCKTCKRFFSDKDLTNRIVIEDTVIPACHKWNDGEYITKPTCTAKGEILYTCTACKITKTEDVVALGHDMKETPTAEYLLSEADCTHPAKYYKSCDRCKIHGEEVFEYGSAKGHQWDEGVISTPDTCEEDRVKTFTCTVPGCGATKTEKVGPTGHEYSEEWTTDADDHWHACKHGNCEAKDAFGSHDWVEEVTKQASCTEKGEKKYTCSVCDATKTEDIEKTGHPWNTTYTVDIPATCTEDGRESIHCPKCNAIKDGSSKTIPRTGHSYGSWLITIPATEDNPGMSTRTCSRCGMSESQIIAQLAPSLPAPAKASKPKASKGAITVKWKRASKKNQKLFGGYQIQVATDPNFTNIVKTATAGKKSSSKKIKGLAKKTQYYVRVRTYLGGQRGVWSTVKSVKTK